MRDEFVEIGHSGGKITFTIKTNETGQKSYQVGWSSSRPVPVVVFAVYALPDGTPVAPLPLGGIGSSFPPPPVPDCFPVFIASDSQGKFGHHCPRCKGYWRSGPQPSTCPYCALRIPWHEFLSEAQLRYVEHYCQKLCEALDSIDNGEITVDMDAVADAAGKDSEKPDFYVSEESQQLKFNCDACGEYNDILGRFAYCSTCKTRNDLQEFQSHMVAAIRERLNSGVAPEDCLRDSVAAFDSFMAQLAKELVRFTPLTKRRRERLISRRFHNIKETSATFEGWFDIDFFKGINEQDRRFVELMFFRRHVYEHNAGEADQKYLDDSGDTTVRLKQQLHENQGDIHKLLNLLVQMARNVHDTFHEIFAPNPEPIEAHKRKRRNH